MPHEARETQAVALGAGISSLIGIEIKTYVIQ